MFLPLSIICVQRVQMETKGTGYQSSFASKNQEGMRKNEIKGRKFEKRRNKNKNRWQKILKNEKTVLHEF